MRYQVERNTDYDFLGESYASLYPNIHRYPATMLPQIGIKALQEFEVECGTLLDPYCGSGSSFSSALDIGFMEMHGFDLNPLAVLITKVKFTKILIDKLIRAKDALSNFLYKVNFFPNLVENVPIPNVTNINYWFSEEVIHKLAVLRYAIDKIDEYDVRNLFLVAFSETVRDCSYTRKSEFKLHRMKEEALISFNPDVYSIYQKKLGELISLYSKFYYPKLSFNHRINVSHSEFQSKEKYFDTVLTSPPYGDSRTTVAYGQFSTLSNEWLGYDFARKVDNLLMGGGGRPTNIYDNSIITPLLEEISHDDQKRALEVSAFYYDLADSIKNVSMSVKDGGTVIYIVGNRTVKNIQLPTDQFIAEQFERNGYRHLITYERAISSKSMPNKNSPTNIAGLTVNTMLFEYIVVCKK